MDEQVDPMEDAPPRRRWRMRVSAVMGSVAALGLVGVWTQRRGIAEGFVDRELAARGVEARYRIDALGLGRQRLVDVRIGDPRDPDLVADSIEIETEIGLDGVGLRALTARGARLRGRVVDGRVSLGAIDRLLPAPSGRPFALPDIVARLDDARVRLETPVGVVGLRIDGGGNLSNGFAGRVAAAAAGLGRGDYRVVDPRAVLQVSIDRGRPVVRGPVRAAGATCADVTTGPATARIDAMFGAALERWQGRLAIETRDPRGRGLAAGRVAVDFAGRGDFARAAGRVSGTATALRTPWARIGTATAAGDLGLGGAGSAFAGRVGWREAALTGSVLAPLSGVVAGTAGSPVGPVAAAAAAAVRRAGSDFDGEAALFASGQGVRIGPASATAASGARLSLDGGDGVAVADGVRIDGTVRTGGGGLPDIAVTVRQARAGAPLTGTGRMARYAAGGAAIEARDVRFDVGAGGAIRTSAAVTLSGPVGNGRVDGLSGRVALRRTSDGRIAVNPDCAVIGFDRFALSGLILDPARLGLCPVGAAMVRTGPGGVAGGVRIAAPRLTGRIGSTPVALAATGAELTLAGTGFALADVSARLGRATGMTRLDFARITGAVAGGTVAGRFEGAAGQIANVPLIVGEGGGDWRLAGGVLRATGALSVSDADADPRFRPMRVPDFALTVAGNDIAARGTITEPVSGTAVAAADIAHDLSAGAGRATLDVAGIPFGADLQPEALTRLTLGVVANVRGTVRGAARIAWDGDGVRSTGVFRTTGMDLAAAFGPVTGLSTEVRFDDLLGLVSAPGQVATVASINPGIAVTDGTVRYRLLPDLRVGVDGGRWPFAGGELVLEPTILDFAENRERRLTFTVTGLEAARFVQLMEFENIAATGVFDGTLPMVFDATGGRIESGSLTVRPGGGTLSYVGPVSNAQLGTFGKLAFDALKSIRYDRLTIGMDGAIDGEIVSRIRFDGISQGPLAVSTGFVARTIRQLPFRFNITIRAPFRGLLGTARSFTDPGEIIRSQLPGAVQPEPPGNGSSPETNVQPQERGSGR